MLENNKFINLIPIKYSNIVRITYEYEFTLIIYTEGFADNEEITIYTFGTIDIPAELYTEYDNSIDSCKWLFNYINKQPDSHKYLSGNDGDSYQEGDPYHIIGVTEEIYFNANGETFLIESNPFPSQN